MLCIHGFERVFRKSQRRFRGSLRDSSKFEGFWEGFRGSQEVSEAFYEATVGFRGVSEPLQGISGEFQRILEGCLWCFRLLNECFKGSQENSWAFQEISEEFKRISEGFRALRRGFRGFSGVFRRISVESHGRFMRSQGFTSISRSLWRFREHQGCFRRFHPK